MLDLSPGFTCTFRHRRARKTSSLLALTRMLPYEPGFVSAAALLPSAGARSAP